MIEFFRENKEKKVLYHSSVLKRRNLNSPLNRAIKKIKSLDLNSNECKSILSFFEEERRGSEEEVRNFLSGYGKLRFSLVTSLRMKSREWAVEDSSWKWITSKIISKTDKILKISGIEETNFGYLRKESGEVVTVPVDISITPEFYSKDLKNIRKLFIPKVLAAECVELPVEDQKVLFVISSYVELVPDNENVFCGIFNKSCFYRNRGKAKIEGILEVKPDFREIFIDYLELDRIVWRNSFIRAKLGVLIKEDQRHFGVLIYSHPFSIPSKSTKKFQFSEYKGPLSTMGELLVKKKPKNLLNLFASNLIKEESPDLPYFFLEMLKYSILKEMKINPEEAFPNLVSDYENFIKNLEVKEA